MRPSRRSVIFAAAVVATASFFSAAFGYAYWSSDGWYEQRIDICDTRNFVAAMTLDDSGSVHVVYHGQTDGLWVIKHAVRDSAKWRLTEVAKSSRDVFDLRASVDDGSVVHVSWCSTDSGFSYASGTSEGFQKASVSIEDFYSGAIAMDSSGVVHGFCSTKQWNHSSDAWDWEFQQWTVSSGEWLRVATYAAPDNQTDFAVVDILTRADHGPRVVMSFRSGYMGPKYLTFANLTDSGLEPNSPCYYISDEYSIHDADMDSQGIVHLAISGTFIPMFEHWYLDGEYWSKEHVDYIGEKTYWNVPDLFIDEQDTVYLTYLQTYYSFDISRLRVAEGTEAGWTISTLETGSAFMIDRPVFTTGSDGTCHIAHFVFDGQNQNLLMYADSDSGLVLTESLKTALLQTTLMALVVWPSAFAFLRWRSLRAEKKRRLAELGLYDHNLK